MYATRIAVTADPRLDRRSLRWKCRSWRRRGRDGQVQKLIGTQQPWTRQERPRSANIKGLRKVEKFCSGSIYATNKHRNLNMNPWRTPALSGG